MKRIYFYFLLSILACMITSCETPYDIRVTQGSDHYVIDGSITNLPGPYLITLKHSAAYSIKSEGSNWPVLFATVCIIDDSIKDQPHFLTELGDGKYVTDSLFRGIPGHTYTLHIQTVNGIELMSYPEQMPPVPEAIITHNEFVDETIFHPEGHKVWITLTDVPNVKNYYQWTYQGVYLFSTGIYSTGDILRPHPSACWMYEYFYFDFNLESDRLFDGQTFDRDITVVPYFSASPYLLTIYTRSLTEQAYKYWYQIDQQVNHSEGLFGTPHSYIEGNMYCLNNAKERVYGFFEVASVVKSCAFLRRNDESPVKNLRLYMAIPCDFYPQAKAYTGSVDEYPECWEIK